MTISELPLMVMASALSGPYRRSLVFPRHLFPLSPLPFRDPTFTKKLRPIGHGRLSLNVRAFLPARAVSFPCSPDCFVLLFFIALCCHVLLSPIMRSLGQREAFRAPPCPPPYSRLTDRTYNLSQFSSSIIFSAGLGVLFATSTFRQDNWRLGCTAS